MRKLLDPVTFRWAVVVPACVYGAALIIGAFWFAQLPNPMASQWSADGTVVSTQSLAAFYATIALLMLATVAYLTILAVKSKSQRDVRMSVAACSGQAIFASGAMLLLAAGQRGIKEAQSAPSPSWIGLALLAALGIGVGLIVWRLCRPGGRAAPVAGVGDRRG